MTITEHVADTETEIDRVPTPQTSNASRLVPTRRISFEESLRDLPRHFAADGDLILSHLAASLSAVFPDGEDFFVRSVRHYRDRITDPVLKRQVAGFIGQEAMHGREHRALNDRLSQLGYPTKRGEWLTKRGLAFRSRFAPPIVNLAATAALEHFTATLAEVLLDDRSARAQFGHPDLERLFLWHALEESEHKAVAFDVYQAVGGGERTRVWTMKFLRAGFVLVMTISVVASLLGDRATYRPGRLRQSWRNLKTSPIVQREVWNRLKDYDRRDFHPDDRDTDALVERWREELFGEHGTLNDKLVGVHRSGRVMSVAPVVEGVVGADAAPTHAVPEMEHLDVLIVGAGLSGIGAGHFIQTECPWATYAIFESRDAIGGTWDLFRYPGIRSDSDMFTLGYSFRPWQGEKSIADGASILQYIKDTAADEGIDDHIRFRHRIVSADWSTEDARWLVVAERSDPHDQDALTETVELTCGFLFSCSGYYRYDHGYTPEFEGIERFAGQVIHPQAWPEDLDHAGKRIVVIGSGATAITLIPSLAVDAGHVTMLQRSPTYIAALPAKNPLANLMRRVLPARWSGPAIRWFNALMTQGSYHLSRRRPELVKRVLKAGVRRQLPKGFDVETHFTPKYDPWDQRLCVVPDGDLFKAIRAGSASVVTDRIETFTEEGIRLESGEVLTADIVVTATGLELLFIGGIQLTVDGEKVDPATRLTYKGMMLEGVPNMALAVGYTNASWTLKCDLTCDYVTRLLNHMRSTGQRQCTPINTDTAVATGPMLGLSSGYVQRSADLLPKQGSAFPWQVHQSYLRDYRALKRSDLTDEVMRFSNPAASRRAAAAPILTATPIPTSEPVRS